MTLALEHAECRSAERPHLEWDATLRRACAVPDREVVDRAPHTLEAAEGQAVLMAETSNSRVILSLTRTPPVSRAAFQVMP